MKKLMMLAALMALALVVVAPAALAQDVKAEALPGGKANAQAGSEEVRSKADPECADAVAGGTTAKACSAPKKAPPPPPKAAPVPAPAPPPKAAPPPPAPKPLPPSGGAGIASLTALGAGALLVGGGLLVRRLIR